MLGFFLALIIIFGSIKKQKKYSIHWLTFRFEKRVSSFRLGVGKGRTLHEEVGQKPGLSFYVSMLMKFNISLNVSRM